jgi:aspartyl-tRNA synthetase
MVSDRKTISANKYRTHTCGQLSSKDADKEVVLSGWVHTRRDHGGLIFIDLRDKWGITQLTFDPSDKKIFSQANKLKNEYVIKATGKVFKRPTDMVNKKISTGEIEVRASSVETLSKSKTAPFAVARNKHVNEELRLKYRFLDLRHPRMQKVLRTRDKFIQHIRKYMHSQGFTEVQTPILANSSPEGARDFLVPSRLYPGNFYALPQAPQQFKQLLMVGGLDRYFQIAPCFRDEDPRADRHAGSFYQIDLEMSFAEQEDVFNVVEPLMIELTKEFSSKKILHKPFPRIPWREAMTKYGSDKPDLRYNLHIFSVTAQVKESNFQVFEEAIKKEGIVHALHVPGGASFSRKDIAELTQTATEAGADGLAYILVKDKPTSPIIKYLGPEITDKIISTTKASSGDAVFFSAGPFTKVCGILGAVRTKAAEKLSLTKDDQAAWVWVTDFPMYEFNEEEGKIDFSHNPFSMPQGGIKALDTKDPTDILGYQYDLALNGFEISSGAVRNHRPDIMYKAFSLAGYSKKEVDNKFGGMIKAFEFGAPPHAGFAPGLDRLLFILLDLPSIRDIYAFPKDSKARDLLMNAPSKVSAKQLSELGLEIELDD